LGAEGSAGRQNAEGEEQRLHWSSRDVDFCDRRIEGSKAEGHPTGRDFVEERKCGAGARKGTGIE
jgi:hypothetical protein